MPTGYTSGVADGTITKFEEYALGCARAFVWQCRDSDEPLSEICASEASTYHAENINRIKAKIVLLEQLEERKKMRDREFDEALASYEEREAERLAVKERYASMLALANQYVPPTATHKKFGEFLVSQLEDSIKFDDYKPTKPIRQPIREWFAEKMAELRRELAYHTEKNEKDIERTKLSNEWLKQLLQSLGAKS